MDGVGGGRCGRCLVWSCLGGNKGGCGLDGLDGYAKGINRGKRRKGKGGRRTEFRKRAPSHHYIYFSKSEQETYLLTADSQNNTINPNKHALPIPETQNNTKRQVSGGNVVAIDTFFRSIHPKKVGVFHLPNNSLFHIQ